MSNKNINELKIQVIFIDWQNIDEANLSFLHASLLLRETNYKNCLEKNREKNVPKGMSNFLLSGGWW